MANDLDILVTNGSTTQFTDDAIQRFVRQKLTVALEWNVSSKVLTVIIYENGVAKNAGDFSLFSVSLASSTLTIKEGTSLLVNAAAFTTAFAAGNGRYEFTLTPSSGELARVTVNMSASFTNPAVGATPQAVVTRSYDFHFLAGRLDGTPLLVDGSRAMTGTLIAPTVEADSVKTDWLWKEPFQTFDTARWLFIGGAEKVSLQSTGGSHGGNFLRATGGTVWAVHKKLIPYDPDRLYRITGRVRQTTDPTNSQKSIYIGLTGVADDGVTYINVTGANSTASQHYIAASAQSLTAGSTWTLFEGYVKGNSASAGGQRNDPSNPATMYTGVRYVRPLFILNYNTGDGVADIDLLEFDDVTEKVGNIDVRGNVTMQSTKTVDGIDLDTHDHTAGGTTGVAIGDRS